MNLILHLICEQKNNIRTFCGNWREWYHEKAGKEWGELRRALQKKVALFIPDPPYAVLKGKDQFRDTFSEGDMNDVVQAVVELLAPTGTCIIFCSEAQAPEWKRKLEQTNLVVQPHTLLITYAPTAARSARFSRQMQCAAQHAVVAHGSKDFKVDWRTQPHGLGYCRMPGERCI